jgi:hypothetical protein
LKKSPLIISQGRPYSGVAQGQSGKKSFEKIRRVLGLYKSKSLIFGVLICFSRETIGEAGQTFSLF